jgi:hypothetical protein
LKISGGEAEEPAGSPERGSRGRGESLDSPNSREINHKKLKIEKLDVVDYLEILTFN